VAIYVSDLERLFLYLDVYGVSCKYICMNKDVFCV
jgi:hypothetical protein